MSNAFRDLLRKVGSGPHTSEDLTRSEAAAATRMMLLQEATPAQIGAFMIAHRIKRPTGVELAGMLDAYDELGPSLSPIAARYRPLVMGIPYDGRSRTAPLSPITALLLTAVGCPVVMHGGRRMPTKEGLPLIEIWQGLGLDWTGLSLPQVQQVFEQTQLGFLYLPQQFPLAEQLVPYREQIGKRPPFATLELFWCPYRGESLIVSGFVHPPTEEMARTAFGLRGTRLFVTVKGLEGSCDLPRERTCIVGLSQSDSSLPMQRLLLHPRDYGFAGTDEPLGSASKLIDAMQALLQGQDSSLAAAAIWNGGFYLWQCGHAADLATGLGQAKALIASGQAAQKLTEVAAAIAQAQRSTQVAYSAVE
ncbi:MAG: anthranilate phosphoribosyltransferase family protein [Pegethrix bostrychoides GSE-TBD4-15B]|jgi:anthranilate phosphoribosyltransferase|uniref:Anthranilate phosphoribosyltransferase family protein n=1 Tax=Pegethrix bostrychoides GSE-TBD4-15B TaxID=2839662 RepID=A0A951PGJ9_9CYAN|nr:anthranilate phosphoribosyltransferase family protein [Pegethrix bostrychoides GSE-TBD4-15B]